jgi:DNA-binding NarL/FixJ family response regulator
MTLSLRTFMPPGIRILLVDDHKLFRAGIRSLLRTIGDLEVVAEAEDGRQALEAVAKHRPDVVLMDLIMPRLNGLDAMAQLVKKLPNVRIVILSMLDGEDSVLQALRAGAVGYIVKTANPGELELAIRAAVRGERFLSSAISKPVIERCLQRVHNERTSLERLPPRLREVLQLIAEGRSTKTIAKELGISARTAESYRAELMKAIDIHDIASLTRYAIQMGLISPYT